MSTATKERVRVTAAAPTEEGTVQYDVAGVGTFTVSYDGHAHPGTDADHLRVAFGRWDGHASLAPQQGPLPEAPVLFGVEILGAVLVDVDEAMQYLASPPERRSSWWLRPWRRHGEDIREVPDGTRKHLVAIIAALVEDFLDRPDAAHLLMAHHRHNAPRRAQQHQDRLARLDHEAALWEELRDYQAALLDYERAWADGEDPRPALPEPPRLGDTYRPLTHHGTYALRQLGLASP